MDTRELHDKRYGWEYTTTTISTADQKKISRVMDFIQGLPKLTKGLDVGCNPGMTEIMRERMKMTIIGMNITAKGTRKGKDWVNADAGKEFPFKDGEFDFVYCGEIIEHVYDSDLFISEVRRVLKKGGMAVITTPNLASFWNRMFLLMGYQPHLYGVSIRKPYGNPVLKYDAFLGHIKLFTHRALHEFIEDNGFTVLKEWGEFVDNPNDGGVRKHLRAFFARFPSLAEDMVIICQKK